MCSFHRLVCLIAAVLALPLMTVCGQNISSNLLERARAASVLAASSATDAGVTRDIAINAVKNALAVQNDSAEAFLLAIKSGDRIKRLAARKAFDRVAESTAEAILNLESIADYAGEAAESAESARQLEKVAAAARTPRDAESAIKKAERAAEAAGKFARKAQPLAEILKKAWLLPVPQVRTATSSNVESAVLPAAIR